MIKILLNYLIFLKKFYFSYLKHLVSFYLVRGLIWQKVVLEYYIFLVSEIGAWIPVDPEIIYIHVQYAKNMIKGLFYLLSFGLDVRFYLDFEITSKTHLVDTKTLFY